MFLFVVVVDCFFCLLWVFILFFYIGLVTSVVFSVCLFPFVFLFFCSFCHTYFNGTVVQ